MVVFLQHHRFHSYDNVRLRLVFEIQQRRALADVCKYRSVGILNLMAVTISPNLFFSLGDVDQPQQLFDSGPDVTIIQKSTVTGMLKTFQAI
jgi:hypothetical protein